MVMRALAIIIAQAYFIACFAELEKYLCPNLENVPYRPFIALLSSEKVAIVEG